MRLAIAGKGGTGKTTIAGTLARVLAQRGRRVIAERVVGRERGTTVRGR